MYTQNVSNQPKFNCKVLCALFMLSAVVCVAKFGVQVDLSLRIQSESMVLEPTPQSEHPDISKDSYSLEFSASSVASAQTIATKAK